MVHSNGTRWESQRFRMDFTGRTKYSGRSADFLFVSAGGEVAARRAMPTSRALARSLGFAAEFRTGLRARFCPASSAGDAGGQSVVLQSEMLPRWPATGARLPATCFGLRSSGHSGKSVSGVGEARRRWIGKSGAVMECTGDMARLEAGRQYFAFCSLCQQLFSLFFRSSSRRSFLTEL